MGKYILKEVHLENFLSHKNTTIRFDKGITALIGENGAGKTSIVEALYYILTLTSLRAPRPRQSHLIRMGSSNAHIWAVFEDKQTGEKIQARVDLRRKGTPNYTILYNGKVVASNKASYMSTLRDLFGLTRNVASNRIGDIISNSVIIGQGRLRDIAESLSNPSKLRKIIEETVGIPDYRKAVERLEKGIDLADAQGLPITLNIPPRRPTSKLSKIEKLIIEKEEKIQEAKNRRKELSERLPSLVEELEKLESRLSTVEEEIRKLISEKQVIEARLQREKELKEGLRRAESDISNLRQKLEEVREAKKRIPMLEERASLLPLVEDGRKLQETIVESREELEKARRALTLYDEIGRLAAYEREAERLEQELRRLRGEERRTLSDLNRVRERLSTLSDVRRRLEIQARSISKLVSIEGGLLEVLEKAKGILEKTRDEISRIEDAIEAVSRQIAEARNKRAEAQASLEALARATSPECPVCGSPLDSERRRLLEARLKATIEEAERTIRDLSRRLAELRREKAGLERLYERLSRILAVAEELAENFDEKEYRDLAEKERLLKASLARIEEEQEKLEEEITRAKKNVEKLNKLRGQLAGLGYAGVGREEIAERVDRLEEEIARLEERLSRILDELEAKLGTRSIEEAARRIVEAREQLSRTRALVEMEPQYERLLRARMEELESLRRELEALETERERLNEIAGILARLDEERSRLQAERERLNREIGSVERAIEELEREISRLEREKAEVDRLLKLYRTAVTVKLILERVQDSIMKESIESIKRNMDEIIDLFNIEYSGVEIVEESNGYTIKLVPRHATSLAAGRAEAFQLSGGEKTVASLAFVLALNRILSGRIGFLVLDEPTAELDESRRRVLIDLLRKAVEDVGVDQLVVVTHHDEITDQADTICAVRKENGVSRVEGCTGD